MNYSFEYIDIILLAMIAGFIFLRLRGILGKRTGHEGKSFTQFEEIVKNVNSEVNNNRVKVFDENAQKEFLKHRSKTRISVAIRICWQRCRRI